MDLFYVAIFLGVLGMCFKGPTYGVAAVGFVLPLASRLPNLPIPLLNSQNLLILAAVASFALVKKVEGRTGIKFLIPIIVFMSFVGISLAWTLLTFEPIIYVRFYDPYNLTITYKNMIFCFILYGLGSLVARTREDLRIAVMGILAGTAFEGCFVCMEVVMRHSARATGHLLEGNTAGAYLAWAFIVALALTLAISWKSWEGRLAVLTTATASVGLLFTMSRGNWLAAIAGAAVVSFVKDRRVLVLMVVVLLASPLWLPERARERIDETFVTADDEPWIVRTQRNTDEYEKVDELQQLLVGGDGSDTAKLDSSSQARLFVWYGGLHMIADNPLGVGFGLFPHMIRFYSEMVPFRAAHNTYLQITAETGLQGMASFLLLLGLLLWECVAAYRASTDPLMKGVALAALASTLTMMISAFFYNFFFSLEVNGEQWMLLGAATQLRRLAAASTPAPAEQKPAQAEPLPLYKLVS